MPEKLVCAVNQVNVQGAASEFTRLSSVRSEIGCPQNLLFRILILGHFSPLRQQDPG
jgi:hypothetical protein